MVAAIGSRAVYTRIDPHELYGKGPQDVPVVQYGPVLGDGPNAVPGAEERAGQADTSGRDRSRGGNGAEPALQQRLVVREPQRRLRIGQGESRPGLSLGRHVASRKRHPSHGREQLLGHRVVPERLDHVRHEVALALEEASERHVHGDRRPGDHRVGVCERGDVVAGADQRAGRVIRRERHGQHPHQRVAALPGRLGRRGVMTGHVSERGAGLGIDVVCIGLMTRDPSVRERLQVPPARGELLGQDARQREAAVRPARERERTARREPDEGAGGAKGKAGQRFGQTRSPSEIRVAERTRHKLYSESCSMCTLQSRDPRRRRLVAKETLTITDNRTGRTFEVPIEDETIRATDLRQIKVKDDDFGLMTYDPAFMNTAACRSAITYIDGDKGILRYRGYPIEQLAEQATFLEVAYLLSEGELPNAAQLKRWTETITYHTYVHTNIIKFLEGFRYDAHPMGMLLGVVGALSTFYPDAKHIHDPANRFLQKVRLLAKAPTIAAFAFRHSRGLPFVFPDNDLDYIGNFVNMTFSIGGVTSPTRCCSARSRSC